jgi:hypothetical protein
MMPLSLSGAELIGLDGFEENLQMHGLAVYQLLVQVDSRYDPARDDLVADVDLSPRPEAVDGVGAVWEARDVKHPSHCGLL